MSFISKSVIFAMVLPGSLLLSQQALAHAHLTLASPASQSEISVPPQQLTLHFSEDLEPAFTGASLSDENGSKVTTGKGTVKASAKNVLVVPVTHPLSHGAYQVNWHALSVDGHKTTGSYRFRVK
ncbi:MULTISPECIES: copper homeostasis periplasmic binding protein CopC [Tatumella]|uniref:Copper resistance protein C n=1 Tax=Tatumella punctata TaxID=399969 RepID=A0ABW1VN22_9GAMM|nr:MULTISPECIES: copper homeostasis periplasmic binding protein CopC [unclassified Tatumella]MBS0855485.1 copper homeostasis periplasmic binding protein CopC [Tatumella sp. JGM16]MBS0877133.1 copper homeostasis periplasmic binding protein CopC [Tatumella sp. JGM82]MBS0890599.1 copper homeostasis periplasmic binding protein CopC [Tatumella sp. JGM94]MBS0893272.1 copper homeostasis periplasmic binding protein CopC [Tatumella sp. JGM130]MBS0901436.1 copper homeostasis periplasmic binding protein 